MLDLTMRQALTVWSMLEEAYYGSANYSRNTVEVYAYLLRPSNPTAEVARVRNVEGGLYYEALLLQARTAAKNLEALLLLFIQLHPGALVDIDGRPFDHEHKVLPFDHRVRVTITREEDA